MKAPRKHCATAIAMAVVLTGCGMMEVKREAIETAAAVKNGPQTAPHRTITNFSTALRCMDGLMLVYGVRDVSVLVEDIDDQTKKVNAGAKDMLTSAIAEMNRRSNAVKLLVFGKDTGSTIAFMHEAGRKNAFAAMPGYGIKGSVTQLDEGVGKKKLDAGVGFNPFVNVGAAQDAAASILALDLTMFSTDDFVVVPGVTSRNSVMIVKEGSGIDGEANIRKFGINYSMHLSRSEGQAQALRTLVELAAVELLGKLTKTPYWICLGSGDDTDEVRNEIADWFSSMFARPQTLVGWFQIQLRARHFYSGPADGQPNDAFRSAVAAYRAALGLSAEPRINLELFSAYLRADHRAIAAKVSPPPIAPSASLPAAVANQTEPPAPQLHRPQLGLTIDASKSNQRFARGEAIKLTVKPTHDAHVICYLHDEHKKIIRFFPNRFVPSSRVRAQAPLALPGQMRFQLVANQYGIPETVACYATEQDVLARLPESARGRDFEPLAVRTLGELTAAIAGASGTLFAETRFVVQIQ